MTDGFADWDAGYVLGALSPDDRRRYEEHLADCADCAAAVRELAGLPGILGELDRAEAESLRDEPPPATPMSGSVQLAARRVLRRRRRTRLLVAAAVVVLLAGGSGAGWALGHAVELPAPALAAARTLRPVGASHLYARLHVTPVGWGTRLDWECDYRGTPDEIASDAPPTTAYSLVVVTTAGRATTVATWTSEGGEAKRLVAATAIPADSISTIEIRLSGSTRALARATY